MLPKWSSNVCLSDECSARVRLACPAPDADSSHAVLTQKPATRSANEEQWITYTVDVYKVVVLTRVNGSDETFDLSKISTSADGEKENNDQLSVVDFFTILCQMISEIEEARSIESAWWLAQSVIRWLPFRAWTIVEKSFGLIIR